MGWAERGGGGLPPDFEGPRPRDRGSPVRVSWGPRPCSREGARGWPQPIDGHARLAQLLGKPRRDISLLPQGVDYERFQSRSRRSNLNGPYDRNTFTVLCVSRLSPEKSLPTLVEAVGFLRSRRRIRLMIVGR